MKIICQEINSCFECPYLEREQDRDTLEVNMYCFNSDNLIGRRSIFSDGRNSLPSMYTTIHESCPLPDKG